MRRIMRSLALTGCIALLGTALTSCDAADRLAAPRDEVAPQYSPGANNSNARYSRILWSGPFTGGTKVVEVDAVGGIIELKHGNQTAVAIWVQPGTVRNNTEFTVVATSEGGAYVHLEATSQGSRVPNDVGMKGFKKPVYLLFNVDVLALQPSWLSTLGIAELQENGKLVPTRSFVITNFAFDEGQLPGTWVVGLLPHFSGWVPIAN